MVWSRCSIIDKSVLVHLHQNQSKCHMQHKTRDRNECKYTFYYDVRIIYIYKALHSYSKHFLFINHFYPLWYKHFLKCGIKVTHIVLLLTPTDTPSFVLTNEKSLKRYAFWYAYSWHAWPWKHWYYGYDIYFPFQILYTNVTSLNKRFPFHSSVIIYICVICFFFSFFIFVCDFSGLRIPWTYM